MRDRKKRNIVIASLCALLVFMGIGYAIISQMLTIKGVSTVAGDWNIYIDSITPNAVGTGVSVSESVGLDKVSASFEANLYAPGDKVEYKVVVKNDGNIDAKLGAVNQKVLNDTEGIVKYSNTLENGYILRHGESYVFYVTTELPEELEELPENTVRAVLDLKLNFTQYTGNGSGGEEERNIIYQIDVSKTENDDVLATLYSNKDFVISGTGDVKDCEYQSLMGLIIEDYINKNKNIFTQDELNYLQDNDVIFSIAIVSGHTDDFLFQYENNPIEYIFSELLSSDMYDENIILSILSKINDSGIRNYYAGNLIIEDSVTSIGESNFYGMKFDNIIMADSVTKLESAAFYRTYANNVTLSNNLQTIDWRSISFTAPNLDLVLPNSLNNLPGNDDFIINSLKLPSNSSLSVLSNHDFWGHDSDTHISKIYIPENLPAETISTFFSGAWHPEELNIYFYGPERTISNFNVSNFAHVEWNYTDN